MTSTDPGTATGIKFMAAASEAAGKLHDSKRDDRPEGYAYALADEVYASLAPAERPLVLQFLMFDHLMGYPLTGGLLDECATETYDLLTRHASELSALALKQGLGDNDIKLRCLITDYICNEERCAPTTTGKQCPACGNAHTDDVCGGPDCICGALGLP